MPNRDSQIAYDSSRPQKHWVEADDGARLYAESVGTGATIICCNGIFCTDTYWKYLVPWFSACGYRVVTWDYRAHGRSARRQSSAQMTLSQMARDLVAVRHHFGESTPILIGHSMGTQVILEYARTADNHYAAAIFVCGTYKRPAESFAVPGAAFFLPLMLTGFQRQPKVLDRVLTGVHPRVAFEIARRTGLIDPVLSNYTDMRTYFEHIQTLESEPLLALVDDLFRHDGETVLDALHQATLIVAGEADLMTPMTRSETMHARITGSELAVIPNGSHAALLEQPNWINCTIESFLERRLQLAS